MSLASPATTLLLRAATPQSKQSIQPPGQPGQKVTPVKIGNRVPLATMPKTCLVPTKTASSIRIQTFPTRKVDNPQVVTCSAQGAALQPGRVLPQGSKLVTIIHNVTGKRTSLIVKSGAAPPAGLGRGGGLNIQSDALRTMQTINSPQAGHGTGNVNVAKPLVASSHLKTGSTNLILHKGVCCVQVSPGEPVAEKTGVSNDGEKNITQGMGPELVDDSGVFEEIEEAEQQSKRNPQILQELMDFCGISEDVE
ncbi:uncharacterized protein LOC127750105 [Frankliniella occidentalis]|uniref:Uncharacterized protein LOC127750105 n=1 Tax=Frankliniella occidentalis TaxID=133901 RepID=A0A9C6UAI0_FRAOC|nr:uncharacterized protein LOC127750105 [Frankliniella occidentalis]